MKIDKYFHVKLKNKQLSFEKKFRELMLINLNYHLDQITENLFFDLFTVYDFVHTKKLTYNDNNASKL